MIASKKAPTPGEIAGHYDELDHFYREIWGEHVHHGFWKTGRESSIQATRQLAELVADRAQIQPNTRVCDIGCGYGATARLLARERGADVTAMTISPAQFRVAESAAKGETVRYVLGDWLRNDFSEESFEAAIAIESSEHMPDLRAFFAQAHRVLRPGARLVICAWLAREGSSRVANRFLLEPICREGRMPQMGTELDYKRLCEETGFVCESFEDITLQVRKTWPICAGRFFLELFRRPRYVRFLCNRHAGNRIFALTIFRIWLAYQLGSMRYGIFTARAL